MAKKTSKSVKQSQPVLTSFLSPLHPITLSPSLNVKMGLLSTPSSNRPHGNTRMMCLLEIWKYPEKVLLLKMKRNLQKMHRPCLLHYLPPLTKVDMIGMLLILAFSLIPRPHFSLPKKIIICRLLLCMCPLELDPVRTVEQAVIPSFTSQILMTSVFQIQQQI